MEEDRRRRFIDIAPGAKGGFACIPRAGVSVAKIGTTVPTFTGLRRRYIAQSCPFREGAYPSRFTGGATTDVDSLAVLPSPSGFPRPWLASGSPLTPAGRRPAPRGDRGRAGQWWRLSLNTTALN